MRSGDKKFFEGKKMGYEYHCAGWTDRLTHVAGGTELPLSVLNLRAELLQQGFLHPPDGGRFSTGLQGQLGKEG